MRLRPILVLFIFAIGVAAVILFTHGPADIAPSATTTVAATIFPIADIVHQIGGDDVEVLTVLPAGASPHMFEPSPSDTLRLQHAALLFRIGGPFDAWAEDLTQAVGNIRVVSLDDTTGLMKLAGEDPEDSLADGTNPHYWLSTANAKAIASRVADELTALVPGQADAFRARRAAFDETLDGLHDELTHALAPIQDRGLIVFHESWDYFAQEFGLTILGVFEPKPGIEPSPKEISDLTDLVHTYHVSVLFSEPQLSTETMKPLAHDLGLTIFTLDPLGGVAGRDTYVDLLRYNADILSHALGNNTGN